MSTVSATKQESDLNAIIENYVVKNLAKGVDLNSLLQRFRGLIPPQEMSEVETAEDATHSIEFVVRRLLRRC